MSEWISVKAKPIPIEKLVAIYGPRMREPQFCYRRDLKGRHGNCYEFLINGAAARIPDATHWMPLPDPPKESTDAD